MILLVDNHDSFVYNLARYVTELGGEALVCRVDAMTLADVGTLAPSHIILSPGPRSPSETPLTVAIVRRFGATIPILGVCLGHQCIATAYGAHVVHAGRPVHGRTSAILHDGTSVFTGLPSPLRAARYHSLAVAAASLPPAVRILARAEDDGEVMAIAHAAHPVVGLQFHPESTASEFGYVMLDRFLHGDRPGRHPLPSAADALPPPERATGAPTATR